MFPQSHIKLSLATGKAREARKRALRLAACALTLFDTIRQGNIMDYEEIKRVMRQEMKKLLGMTTEFDASLPKVKREILYDYCKSNAKELEEALDDNDFRLARISVLKIIQEQKWDISEESIEFKVICREFLKMTLQFSRLIAKRSQNDFFEYDEPILIQEIEPSHPNETLRNVDNVRSSTISQLLPKFIEDLGLRNKSESYCIDCNVIIGKVLTQMLGDIYVSQISTKDVDRFIEILRKMPPNFTKKRKYRDIHPLELSEMKHEITLGQSRIRTITFILSSFFQYCIRKGELSYNPVVKNMAGPKPKSRGSSWTVEELYGIFNSTEYIHDTFDEPYQFWIPILGLFTGARHKELAQIYVEDVTQDMGIWGLNVTEENSNNDDKSVKTGSSERFIPLHDFIIDDLGFVRYTNEMKELGHKRVFSELKKWKAKGFRGQSSKWFGEWKQRLGIKGKHKTFHSFRHWFRTYLENYAHLNAYEIAPLLGHSDQKLMTLNYGEVFATTLRDRIMRIDYKKDIELDLSHLKRSRFARPIS